MKTLTKLSMIVLLAVAGSAFADVNTGAASGSDATALTVVDSHAVTTGSDLSRAVGMATAPALTTTLTETCMGSTSAGAGFSGGSFSFGTTWRDQECVNRLNAREIRTYGDVQAAKEIMCSNDVVREAFQRVGRPCAEDGGIYTVTPVAAAPAPTAVPSTAVVGTDVKVHDDQDETAKQTQIMLDQAAQSASSLRSKGF